MRNLATILPLKFKLTGKLRSKSWKIVDFPKISIKMKKSKIFSETQTAGSLKGTVHSPPNPSTLPDKSFLRLWNKDFLTKIYKNIQIFVFKELWKCSFWAFKIAAMQMFFLAITSNIFARKLVKSESFLVVLRQHTFFSVE